MESPTLVAGVKAKADLGTGREDHEYMKEIAILEAWKHPATLITMALAHYNSGTEPFYHFDDQMVPERTTISGAYAADATVIVVADSKRFVVGNLAEIENTGEVVLITDISYSAHELTIVREYGVSEGWTSTAAAIVDGYYLRRISSAYMQGYPMPSMVATKTNRRVNYCQEHRTSFGVSELVYNSRMRGNSEWDHERTKTEIEHWNQIEKEFFKGKPYAGDGSLYDDSTGNTAPATTAGFDHWIVANNNTDMIQDQSELSMFEYLEMLENFFAYGSNEKFQYSPGAWFTALDKWGITKGNTFMEQKVMGMRVGKWVRSPNKVMYFVEHDMFKRAASTLYYYNYILDHEYTGFVVGPNGATHWEEALRYANLEGKTLVKQEIRTHAGLLLRLADCHARMRFKTIGA